MRFSRSDHYGFNNSYIGFNVFRVYVGMGVKTLVELDYILSRNEINLEIAINLVREVVAGTGYGISVAEKRKILESLQKYESRVSDLIKLQ